MVLRNVDNLVAIVRNFHLIDIKVQWQLARASIHAAGAIVDGGSILEEVRCLFEFSVAGGDLVYLARAAVLLDSISAASPAAVDGALRAITDSFVSCRPDAQYSLNQALLLSFFLRDLADLLVQHDGPARLRFICRWVDAITEQLRNACDDCEVASNMALKLKLTGEILVGDFTGIDLSGMVDAVIGCILVPFPDRPAVIRSVLPRCLQLLFRKNALDTHTLHACVSKFWILASADVAPDAHSSSLAAAILVQVGAEHDIELAAIFELNAFWDTVIRYFLHDDIVVRKRGAFLAQYFLSICHGAPGSDETSAPGGAAGSKRRLGRRGEREGCLDPDGCAVVAPTKRHWLHDFLAIYGQIEGCRYVHLVEQVLGPIEILCAMLYRDTDGTFQQSPQLDGPQQLTLDFRWIQIILQGLFRGQLIAVRKHALNLVLSGSLSIRPTDAYVDWVAADLLPAIDSSLYFPPLFKLPNEAELVVGASVPCEYPGLLLPSFLSQLVAACAAEPSKALLPRLVRNIVNAICGPSPLDSADRHTVKLESLTTCKWALAAFALPSVQHYLVEAPPSLESKELAAIRSFVQDRVMTVNATVWNQFFAGLVPLCLSAADYQLVGPNYAALERCDVSVLGLLWGFRMWGVSAVRQYPLLKIALGRWARGQGLSADSIFSDASSQGALEIALAASVLIEVPTVSEGLPMEVLLLGFDSTPSVGAMVCMLVDDACRLYSSPYMKTSAQARAVWFVHGVFLSLQYSADCCHQGEGLEVRKFAELILTHFAEKNIFVDLALYFSIIIKTVLGGRLNAHDASHPHSGAIFSYLETLSKCTAVFADMLCASHLRFQAHREKNSAVSSGIGKVVELAAHSVQDVLLMLERPTSLVTLPLLQCCSALVLPLSVMIVNSAVPTTVDSDSLSDLLLRLCRIIHSLDVPSAAAFRAEAASTDAVVKSLNADVLLECSGLYGKFSSKFITAKWSLLRSGISAVLCATKSSSFSDFLQSVLQTVSESITCFPLLAVPEAISCCSDILHFVLTAPEGSAALQNSQKVDLVARMLESCWKSCVSDDSLFTASIFSFIKLAFQPATLRLHESLPVLGYFQILVEMGINRRPHILQNLVLHLFFIWKKSPMLFLPFVSEFRMLLLYKEFVPNEYQSVQMEAESLGNITIAAEKPTRAVSVPVVRLVLLQFLGDLTVLSKSTPNNADEMTQSLNKLILDLLGLNFELEYLKASPLGSEKYSEKLRAWQALCILSKHIGQDIIIQVKYLIFKALKQSVAHSIRVHMEIFLASLLIKFPQEILPVLLLELEEFNHGQQILGSLLITIGHSTESMNFYESETGAQFVPGVLRAIYPWLLCSPGLPRTIAQLIVYRLFPTLQDVSMRAAFETLYRFLLENKETSKMRIRQIRFFREYDFREKCTVAGLLALRKDADECASVCGVIYAPSPEDIIPTHLLNVISEHLKGTSIEAVSDETLSGHLLSTPMIGDDFSTLQTKRIPLDDLQLFLNTEDCGSARVNANSIKRQEIIVCATLVSKATNLGGLARTCEIFAVEKLVLADINITRGDVFQAIAVSSSSWLPMEQVTEQQLVSFLRYQKNRGYAILGLEQTDSSQSLHKCKLPSRCVLLLGKEREGIPVEILNEVDFCIEIPQFGVTRSLNVHVSASLALWEITTQNTTFITGNS